MTQASLAYRNNQADIWRGHAPEKYTRILPHVTGSSVLELGSAEGVLSLLMAEAGKDVTAVEVRVDRHQEALRLKERWLELGHKVETCRMVQGDIRTLTELQSTPFDTLVAVRSVYYLREDAVSVLKSLCVDNVVLCGNRNRAWRYTSDDIPADDKLQEWNKYASWQGMSDLLVQAGYQVQEVVGVGDPIVTGRRDKARSTDHSVQVVE